MADPGVGEGQPQQPNLEQNRDARIPKVIDELNTTARLMKDPRLLSMERGSSNIETPYEIRYRTADGLKAVYTFGKEFKGTDFPESDLAKRFKDHERVIALHMWLDELYADPEDYARGKDGSHGNEGNIQILMALDKNNPTIVQPITEDGRRYHNGLDIIGTEKFIERPKLLAHILDAVSGEKRVDYRNIFQALDQGWHKTFDNE